MTAVFGTTCDCFVFIPWTGLQVKRATSVTEKAEKKKKKKKSGTAESMLGKKMLSSARRTCRTADDGLEVAERI